VLVLLVARALVRPLRRLREGALRVAHEELPAEVERIRAGQEPGEIEPIPVYTSEEIGQVAHAVDDLHEQALMMAAEQARLQLHVSDMFETLSRRSRSLVDQQLSLIDDLERDEEDPQRLDALFKLDHLAARMRRNGTNLLVLAGAKLQREKAEPVPVAGVINAAASQVENYQRVVITAVPASSVVGSAVGDIIHLVAELIDNALHYSPPASEVRVSAVHTGNRGLVIEVRDSGLGMTEADLRIANTRLESGGEVTPYTTRHMGLFVAGRLARQHRLVVRLRSSVSGEPRSGMTAGVFIPAELIARSDIPDGPEPRDAHATTPAAHEPEDVAALEALHDGSGLFAQSYRNGDASQDESQSLLPRRDPGASGIVGIPRFEPREPAAGPPAERDVTQHDESAPAEKRTRPPSSPLGDTDVIFQRMVSEWLIDPTDLMEPMQSWESVWDSGWEAAAQAQDAPVDHRTEQGLPLREPGARLVPGSAAHHRADDDNGVDPDAIRASLSSHWSGVRAGRSHASEDHPERDDE